MPRRLFNSFGYAFTGIGTMIRSEANARIHLCFMALVLFGGWFFTISVTEWCIILLAIAMVFAAEAFNTAIENLTDLVSPDPHPLAGKAKDVAAGAVLITAIGACMVGILIFLPKVWQWVQVLLN